MADRFYQKCNQDEQIKLVSSFDWLDCNALSGIDEELRVLIKDSLFLDEARCNALCRSLKKRVEMLIEVVRECRNSLERV